MKQSLVTFATIASCFTFYLHAFAAEQTITAKIKSVDTDKNTITIDDTVLDVSRKTKIIIDGEKASISDLKGKQAKVTYDDALETAISIIVGKEAKTDDEAAAKVMKALQGEWKCVLCEQAGEVADKKAIKEQDRRVSIEGNTYSMKRTQGDKRSGYKGKFEINPVNNHFDWIGEGPDGGLVKWTGIYELDGDALKVCYRYNKDGQAVRPTKFKTDSSKKNPSVYYEFKRDTE